MYRFSTMNRDWLLKFDGKGYMCSRYSRRETLFVGKMCQECLSNANIHSSVAEGTHVELIAIMAFKREDQRFRYQ